MATAQTHQPMIQTRARLLPILAATAMIAPVLTPEAARQVDRRQRTDATRLTGADFEFLKSRGIQGRTASIGPRADARRLALNKRAGEQQTVDVDTAARGASALLRTQVRRAAPKSLLWSASLVRYGSKHAIMDRRAGTHQCRRRFAFPPAWSADETGSIPPLLFDTRDNG